MLPQIASALGTTPCNSGGWMSILSRKLIHDKQRELTVLFPMDISCRDVQGQTHGLSYYSFPWNSQKPEQYMSLQEVSFKKILSCVQPDFVHIWGSEYPHTLAMVRVCQQMGLLDKTCISIQGLISVYAQHYFARLPESVLRKKTFRDFLKQDGFLEAQKKFVVRGEYEVQALQMAKHVIGRTEWDLACVRMIHPGVIYHQCNEILREDFYNGAWKLQHCRRHTIFSSQWGYPVKGFHQMLSALKLLKERYPDVRLITTGKDPRKVTGKDKLKQNYYGKYIANLICKLKLEEQVCFLGKSLNAAEMKEQYLSTHVFALPSSIENSPNSLGEAMILGVPSVASDVGGVSSMCRHGQEGFLYPFDEPYMLAHYIGKIFDDDKLAENISDHARKRAVQTHSIERNIEDYLEIYHSKSLSKSIY